MKYKIGDIAKLFNISTNTVRRYESQGCLAEPKRDENGYRYYNEHDVFELSNARVLRKYGFTQEELGDMKQFTMQDVMNSYQDRMKAIDKQIAYMTYVRHRIKDDYVLMERCNTMGNDVFQMPCMAFHYVLYCDGGKLLTEPKRLEQIWQYMYESPEVQRVYIVRKADLEADHVVISMGWAVKQMVMEKYELTESEYTVRYDRKQSVMGFVKIPSKKGGIEEYSSEELKEKVLKNHLNYIERHHMEIAGDILIIVITKAVENGEEMKYLLVNIPVEH